VPPALHFLLVLLLAAHSASLPQPAHTLLALQIGLVGSVQSAWAVQSTQAPSLRHWSPPAPLRARHSESPVATGLWVQPRQVLVLTWQMGVVPLQWVLAVQATQAPLAAQ